MIRKLASSLCCLKTPSFAQLELDSPLGVETMKLDVSIYMVGLPFHIQQMTWVSYGLCRMQP